MLKKILIIGGSGMLGNTLLRFFLKKKNFTFIQQLDHLKLNHLHYLIF